MPGDTPQDAVRAFLSPILAALRCLKEPEHVAYTAKLNVENAATINQGRGLAVPAGGAYEPNIRFDMALNYRVVEEPSPDGHYRVRSTGYIVTIMDNDGADIIGFHWHPGSVSPETKPHVHIGEKYVSQEAKLHLPSPRVTVEEVIRIAIETFGAKPARSDWSDILVQSQALHEKHRTWSERNEAPDNP